MPYYLSQEVVPEWFPPLNVDTALEEHGLKLPDRLTKGKTKKINERRKGVMISDSPLDGRHPWPAGITPATFWNVKTFEDCFGGLADVTAMDNWFFEQFDKYNTGTPSDVQRLFKFKEEAFEQAREHFQNASAPTREFMKSAIRRIVNCDHTEHLLTEKQLEEMAESVFNIDCLWKMPIAEMVCHSLRTDFLVKSQALERELRVGRLFGIYLRGIWERFDLLHRPCLLRLVPKPGRTIYSVVIDVLVDMGILVLLEVECLKVDLKGNVKKMQPMVPKFNKPSYEKDQDGVEHPQVPDDPMGGTDYNFGTYSSHIGVADILAAAFWLLDFRARRCGSIVASNFLQNLFGTRKKLRRHDVKH